MGNIVGRAHGIIQDLRKGLEGSNANQIEYTALNALQKVNTTTTEFSNKTSTAPIDVLLSGVYHRVPVKTALPPVSCMTDVITCIMCGDEYKMKIGWQQRKHAHTHWTGTHSSFTSIDTWWTTRCAK